MSREVSLFGIATIVTPLEEPEQRNLQSCCNKWLLLGKVALLIFQVRQKYESVSCYCNSRCMGTILVFSLWLQVIPSPSFVQNWPIRNRLG